MKHLGFLNLNAYLQITPASQYTQDFINPWEDNEPTLNQLDIHQFIKTLPFYGLVTNLGEFAVSSQAWGEITTLYRNSLNTAYGRRMLTQFPAYIEKKGQKDCSGVIIEKLESDKGYLVIIYQANKFKIKLYEDLDFLARLMVANGWVQPRLLRPLLKSRLEEALVAMENSKLDLDGHQRKDRIIDSFNYLFIATARQLEGDDINNTPQYLQSQGEWLEANGINLTETYLPSSFWTDVDLIYKTKIYNLSKRSI